MIRKLLTKHGDHLMLTLCYVFVLRTHTQTAGRKTETQETLTGIYRRPFTRNSRPTLARNSRATIDPPPEIFLHLTYLHTQTSVRKKTSPWLENPHGHRRLFSRNYRPTFACKILSFEKLKNTHRTKKEAINPISFFAFVLPTPLLLPGRAFPPTRRSLSLPATFTPA